MNNIFAISAVVSIVYLIIKFIEMRFVDKENKPLKTLIRDALLVYVSSVFGFFILEQLNPVIVNVTERNKITPVFTDNPEF